MFRATLCLSTHQECDHKRHHGPFDSYSPIQLKYKSSNNASVQAVKTSAKTSVSRCGVLSRRNRLDTIKQRIPMLPTSHYLVINAPLRIFSSQSVSYSIEDLIARNCRFETRRSSRLSSILAMSLRSSVSRRDASCCRKQGKETAPAGERVAQSKPVKQ